MTDVIELSVAETNKLRIKLGLKPLRGVEMEDKKSKEILAISTSSPYKSEIKADDNECLELSIEETDRLRASLGLKPLKAKNESIHRPAENEGKLKELEEQLEREKLQRQVQHGIEASFESKTLAAEQDVSVISWAKRMLANENDIRQQEPVMASNETLQKKRKKKKLQRKGIAQSYEENDLEGLHVGHSISDFEEGSTTILTLADAPLLKTAEGSKKITGLNNELIPRLENALLADEQGQRDRLREKRRVEMGMGRAGGYAGFDDDEFEELGGVQGQSNMPRGSKSVVQDSKEKRRGFKIGDATLEHQNENDSERLFAHERGKAISLEQSSVPTVVSDFMTAEEYAALQPKKKKDIAFKKSKVKKEKKSKRPKKIEQQDEEDEELQRNNHVLDDLQGTAVVSNKKRKRRHGDIDDEALETSEDYVDAAKRRAKFDEIMEKGNERSAAAFKSPSVVETKSTAILKDYEEPDDSFLNDALAKARRLRKLRDLSGPTGADAVAQAVLESKSSTNASGLSGGDGYISFTVDETEEFTRALRARQSQEERQKNRKGVKGSLPQADASSKMEISPEESEEKSLEIGELAKQIEEDETKETEGDIGTTAAVAPVGRGISGVLAMLRHTGEISGRNAGREELRGRAKDERTYEDYAPLNLEEVVRIGKGATEKDRELASREIKLEYRDDYGRLLTRKEAYRQLCYQFHGHGSGAKNEERRLRQIEREQAEARIASKQASGAGSLGALKATQKATGKAFVIHKT
jgi:U4/U6.U5 tri-snRNP-associated protein 1